MEIINQPRRKAMASGTLQTDSFWGKTLDAHVIGKAASASVIDFVLQIPYTNVPYNITFERVNVSGISGVSHVTAVHATNPTAVYFRVSPPSSVSTNQVYIANARFTITPSA